MNWDRWLGSQAQILPHPKNEWHSPWPHLYARCSVLATLLSYSRACWGSHHLRAKIPMSHSGIRGPPGSQLAPQTHDGDGNLRCMHWALLHPRGHSATPYLQGPSRGSTHDGPVQQQGDRDSEVKPPAQGHTDRKWRNQDLSPHLLDWSAGALTSASWASLKEGGLSGGGGHRSPQHS